MPRTPDENLDLPLVPAAQSKAPGRGDSLDQLFSLHIVHAMDTRNTITLKLLAPCALCVYCFDIRIPD